MTALERSKTIVRKVGTEIVDRANPRTTGGRARKIRNYVGIGSSILLLLVCVTCWGGIMDYFCR